MFFQGQHFDDLEQSMSADDCQELVTTEHVKFQHITTIPIVVILIFVMV